MRHVAIVLALLLMGAAVWAQDDPVADPGKKLFDAGVAAYNKQNFEEAKQTFLDALKKYYEGNATVLTWLGTACYELHQWDEAINHLTQATEADPEYPVAFNNLGNAYLEQGNPLLKEAGTADEGRAMLGKAVASYLKAIALDEEYFYPRYNLALTYTALEEWDKAWNTFHQALQLKPEDPDVWRSFGRALKQAGEYEKAIERYQTASELDTQCLECFVQLGWLFSKQARWPEAETAYRSAAALASDNFDAQLGLGIALYSQRKCDEARAPLAKAGELKADSFETRYNLGLVEDCLQNPQGAEAAYASAAALKPNDAPCLNNLGVAIFNQDKPCDSMDHFRAAIAADESYVMAHINLALAMDACGQDEDEALKQWQATAKKFPRQASAHCGLANALYRKGNPNEALAEYLRCLALDECNVEAHNNVGLIYLDRDQLDEALAHFRQALNCNDKYVPALNNLGVAYEKQGKKDQAKEMYEKALAIDPNYDKAKENLERLNKAPGGG